jgi:hypothetical protein
MPKNVLVLGAGASQHYGFPVASDLVNQVIEWPSRGYGGLLINCGIHHIFVEEFADQLARSGFTSIDQYVAAITQDHLRKIGKQLIALFLSISEVRITKRGLHHWYERAANLLIPGDMARFPARDIGVITFNYDRSFEYYMLCALMARFRDHHALEEIIAAFKRLPFVHIYGSLGVLPELTAKDDLKREYGPINDDAQLAIAVNAMQLLGEGNASDPESGIAQARELLRRSTGDVIFLGFGFSDDNLTALDLPNTVPAMPSRALRGTRMGITGDENTRMLMELLKRHGHAAWLSQYFPTDVANAVDLYPVSIFGQPR